VARTADATAGDDQWFVACRDGRVYSYSLRGTAATARFPNRAQFLAPRSPPLGPAMPPVCRWNRRRARGRSPGALRHNDRGFCDGEGGRRRGKESAFEGERHDAVPESARTHA
jgi:hypothetical protein